MGENNGNVTQAHPVEKQTLSIKLALDLEDEIRYHSQENADMLDFVACQPQSC